MWSMTMLATATRFSAKLLSKPLLIKDTLLPSIMQGRPGPPGMPPSVYSNEAGTPVTSKPQKLEPKTPGTHRDAPQR